MSDKVNVELFSLTYGSLVRAIVKETNNIEDANNKLAKIGENMGDRITDDIVVNYDNKITSLKDACEMIAKFAFKNYLGVTAEISEPSENRIIISILDNPITRYVSIPPEYDGLIYLMPLLGLIKKMLEQLHFSTEVTLIHDRLTSQECNTNDIEIKLLGILTDTLPAGEYL